VDTALRSAESTNRPNLKSSDDLPVTVIEPSSGWLSLNLADVWRYRDLLLLLIWRDISARYRQSVVGYGWAIIRPVLSMIIFTFVFGRVAGIQTGSVPYALFAFTGLLPWMYFSGAIASSTASVVGGGALLKKVYFPRLILPVVGVVAGLVDLLIQSLVLIVLLFWYRVSPGPQIVFAPLFLLSAAVTSLALGLWLTALNVKYRDIGQAMPFLVQIWMWMSPVVYPGSRVPEAWQAFYAMNPMVGVIEGFRWSIIGSEPPDWTMVSISFGAVIVLLVTGLFYFRKTETTFADII
jgi:lipopolysaccharide transport system permease protein